MALRFIHVPSASVRLGAPDVTADERFPFVFGSGLMYGGTGM